VSGRPLAIRILLAAAVAFVALCAITDPWWLLPLVVLVGIPVHLAFAAVLEAVSALFSRVGRVLPRRTTTRVSNISLFEKLCIGLIVASGVVFSVCGIAEGFWIAPFIIIVSYGLAAAIFGAMIAIIWAVAKLLRWD
jgi:hypothetical protein